MPQVTKLVDRYVPKVTAETLMDVGTGDGETIQTMLFHFHNPFVFYCDPDIVPTKILGNHAGDVNNYHESMYYDKEVDVITFFDSLACYNKEDGGKHLQHAMEKAKKMVLVWTPDCYYPYSQFKSGWHVDDFLNLGFCVYKAVGIHEGPPIKANGILAWKLTS